MRLEPLLLAMHTHGFCLIDQVIPESRCTQIRDCIVATVEQQRNQYPAPDHVGFVPGVINHDQSFAQYLADTQLLGLAEVLLGDHVRISFTSAIINEPGNSRGQWHADWPFNQTNAGHIRVPYPDCVFHLTTLWMLSSFTQENGGTLVVHGSHRANTNPTANTGTDGDKPVDAEINVTGQAGTVLIMDSRLWHATAKNQTEHPRVALAVRYAPWWLNLEVLRPESDERRRMVDELDKTDNQVPSLPREVFEQLPENVKPLYRHWVTS